MVRSGFMRAFGASLRRSIARSTSNRFKAFLAGIGVTALLQSSTAAALIVSSFAARGLITVMAAIAVMLGADVGTTLVAQVLSFDLSWLMPVMLITGFVINKSMDKGQLKNIGKALVGIGLVLLSLSLVKEASEPLKTSDTIRTVVEALAGEPVMAILISMILTWLAHSSLAMVLFFMTLVASGTISVPLGLVFVLGANIGGAIAPIVMTLRDNPEGRRVPLGNFMIKSIGVLFAFPFLTMTLPYLEMLDENPARQIVNFHTAFNLGLALLFIPFIGPLTRLSEKILPDRPQEEDKSLPRYLDDSAITTPPVALACAARETLRVSDIIQKMLRDTLEALRKNDTKLVKDISERDDIVDSLYDSIKNYLAHVSSEELDEEEGVRYMQILTFSTNLEHIGDIIDKSLMELASKKIRNQDSFSKEGFDDITFVHSRVMENLQLAQNVFMSEDIDMARKLLEEKSHVREHEKNASEKHFGRLRAGVAETIATSSLHLDILRDLRNVNSYLTAVAYPILEQAGELYSSRLKKKKTLPKTPEEGGSSIQS